MDSDDDGIDRDKGIIDVYRLLPKRGDSLMIVNCGSHFEVRQRSWSQTREPPLLLTEEDFESMKQGTITWN
jgi:hypothetical protein